ncbi:uncharacterized protein M6B38_405295 [Iris pallida]|uniref:Uncharacterized protein n=1 Tax=Iris pallida TaxID=29817 RepID=A0AAX6FQ45_IRIPA|nr:uncharacterized protein M6B38_405295 [Iris pallida]
MIVPSKSIMKLSNDTIGNHPIFAGFLNALSPIGGAEIPSFHSLYEEADSEANLHGILEKQIEEISRLVDGSKECSKDSPLKVKRVNQDEGKHMKPVMSSSVSSNSSRNNIRRSTRSQNKQQVEMEFDKDLLEDKPCLNHPKYLEDKTFLSPPKKDSEEERLFLSPLAARAAFASLIHETPLKAELSASHVVERENHQNLDPKDPTDCIEVRRLNFRCKYVKPDDSSQNRMPSVSNPIQDTDGDNSVASKGASRCSNKKGATQKKTKLKKSLYKGESLQTSEETKCGKMSSLTIVDNSTACGKLSAGAITTRLTRSSVQKEIGGPSDEQNGASSEKIISPTNIKRVIKQLEKTNPGANQKLKRSDLTRDTYDIHEVTSPVNTRVTRSSNHREKNNIAVNQDPKENGQAHDKPEATKPVNTISVTCSNKQTKTSKPSVNQEVKRSVKAQDKHDQPEDLATPNNNESKNKRLNFSEDPIAELAQEKSKRTRAFPSSTKEDSGETLEDESGASKKKKTGNKDILSKKPEQRFSLRLKFLPRTRSQVKA